jgi:hypothetical protein
MLTSWNTKIGKALQKDYTLVALITHRLGMNMTEGLALITRTDTLILAPKCVHKIISNLFKGDVMTPQMWTRRPSTHKTILYFYVKDLQSVILKRRSNPCPKM